jgi:hypothetical protein
MLTGKYTEAKSSLKIISSLISKYGKQILPLHIFYPKNAFSGSTGMLGFQKTSRPIKIILALQSHQAERNRRSPAIMCILNQVQAL